MVLCLKTWKSRTLPGLSKMQNLIIVTGGAGFVGSNLIELLLKKTKFKIISLDNYSTGSKKSFTVLEVAKMFKFKIKFLPPRLGERYASALTSMNMSNKVYKYFGKVKLKDYIKKIVKNT